MNIYLYIYEYRYILYIYIYIYIYILTNLVRDAISFGKDFQFLMSMILKLLLNSIFLQKQKICSEDFN